jgi:hypothetical protein
MHAYIRDFECGPQLQFANRYLLGLTRVSATSPTYVLAALTYPDFNTVIPHLGRWVTVIDSSGEEQDSTQNHLVLLVALAAAIAIAVYVGLRHGTRRGGAA